MKIIEDSKYKEATKKARDVSIKDEWVSKIKNLLMSLLKIASIKTIQNWYLSSAKNAHSPPQCITYTFPLVKVSDKDIQFWIFISNMRKAESMMRSTIKMWLVRERSAADQNSLNKQDRAQGEGLGNLLELAQAGSHCKLQAYQTLLVWWNLFESASGEAIPLKEVFKIDVALLCTAWSKQERNLD